MKYQHTHQNEATEITMQFIEANRNWNVEKQEYKTDDNCKANLSECKIYKRGQYFILEHSGIVHYWEHDGKYCYLEDALHYMNPDKPAKWKTLDKLISFRQAIRENNAQWMALEDLLKENITQKEFNVFISTARVFDKRHHGTVTF